MWKDFKAFLMRGNVIDLATAVVIGAAFGKIVTALVDNIIMPCIGMLTSGVDFANMKYVLKEGTLNAETLEMEGEVAIGYGVLINAIIQFIIIAFVIFIVIRLMNKAKDKLAKKQEEEKKEEETPADIALLTEIRDLLKNSDKAEEVAEKLADAK
ncbi:MAG TPA: large conductance mechanosensitive channel protein MscL [Clostridiales bacterium]|jgi:large conductance mechanosensitive channel|nr:large conductance mechanosensitive channel protein MscL [Clostridiales bacterium]